MVVESVGAAKVLGGELTVTVMLKLKVPALLGVPLKTFEVSWSPGGGVSMAQL